MRRDFSMLWWPTLALALTTGCTIAAKLPGFGSESSSSSGGGAPTASAAGGGGVPGERVSGDVQDARTAEASGECPSYMSIDDELEPIVTLMWCPKTVVRSSGDPVNEIGAARSWIRGGLDQGLTEDPFQLPRAAYVHLCARQMREDTGRLYPAMAIGCAWHADRIDQAALAGELKGRRPGAAIARQVAADIPFVRERALAAFPRATSAREWEVFYELPTKVRKEALARRTSNAKAYQTLSAFSAAIESGTFEGCAGPLRDSLTAYLKGAKSLDALRERMTDPVGYALAEALARCHYYNEREPEAGVLLSLLEKARRRVTVAEQVRFAQIDVLAADSEKAKKFPNLVGTKYSSVNPTDLRPVTPWDQSKLDEKWFQSKYELMRLQNRDGRIARISKTATGATIHFQKERVPVVDVRCHETNRIDSIDRDGKIRYREECTRTPKGMAWSQPEPAMVSDARGLAPGRFVHLALDGDKGAVVISADGPGENARIERLADVVLVER